MRISLGENFDTLHEKSSDTESALQNVVTANGGDNEDIVGLTDSGGDDIGSKVPSSAEVSGDSDSEISVGFPDVPPAIGQGRGAATATQQGQECGEKRGIGAGQARGHPNQRVSDEEIQQIMNQFSPPTPSGPAITVQQNTSRYFFPVAVADTWHNMPHREATNELEMKALVGVLIAMGVVQPRYMRTCWSKSEVLHMPLL